MKLKMCKWIYFFLLFLYSARGTSQKDGYAFSADSTPIYFRIYGTGRPLLIINGGPGMNSDGFENLAILLSKNNQTIIYDQRGTGKSVLTRVDSTTISMQLMADDIESLRKYLKLDSWSILGHSFGGMLASFYATEYPDRIEKLVLSSSGGIDLGLLNYVNESINSKLTQTQNDSVVYLTKRINEGDTNHLTKLLRGKILAHAYVVDTKFIPVIGERLTQGNSVINQLIWTSLDKIKFNCARKLESFGNPVLIIQGKQDIIFPKTADIEHLAFKNSRIVLMDHCIHYGWLDNPEVYFKEINTFLASK